MQCTESDLIAWSIRRVLRPTGPSRPDLDRLTGRYALGPNFVITVSRLGGKLFLRATNQPLFLMAPESPTVFTSKSVGARIEFEVDGAGTVPALTLVQNGVCERTPRAQ